MNPQSAHAPTTSSPQSISPGGIPVGAIMATVLVPNNYPPGWLPCDGSSVNSILYPKLAALMAKTPNLGGLVLLGAGGVNPVTKAPYVVGDTDGESQHTLTPSEVPPHTHGVSLAGQGDQNWSSGLGNTMWGGSTTYTTDDGGQDAPNGQLGGGPHNNMQPYYVVNYLIYAGLPA